MTLSPDDWFLVSDLCQNFTKRSIWDYHGTFWFDSATRHLWQYLKLYLLNSLAGDRWWVRGGGQKGLGRSRRLFCFDPVWESTKMYMFDVVIVLITLISPKSLASNREWCGLEANIDWDHLAGLRRTLVDNKIQYFILYIILPAFTGRHVEGTRCRFNIQNIFYIIEDIHIVIHTVYYYNAVLWRLNFFKRL